jgi:hypothetical protein
LINELPLNVSPDVMTPVYSVRLQINNAEHFDLAMELLRDWRIDRFYKGRARAFNLGQSRPVKRCVPREPLNLGKLGQSIENNPCCQDKDE